VYLNGDYGGKDKQINGQMAKRGKKEDKIYF